MVWNLRAYIVCEVELALYSKVNVFYGPGTMLDVVNRELPQTSGLASKDSSQVGTPSSEGVQCCGVTH